MQAALAPVRRFALLAAVSVSVIANPGAPDAFAMPRLLLLTLFAAALSLLLLPLCGSIVRTRSMELTGVAALVIAMLLAFALRHDQPFQAVYGAFLRANGVLCYAALAVVLAAAAVAFDVLSVPRVLRALGVTGAVMATYGIVQWLGLDPIDWHRGFVIVGTFGNPDFASGLMGMGGVALTWWATGSGVALRTRLLAGAGALAVAWTVWQSEALQGLLALLAGVLVTLVVRDAAPQRWARRRPWWTAFVSVLVIGLAVAGPLRELVRGANAMHRIYMWQAAIEMFRQHPIAGVGLDAYGDWYRAARSAASIDYLGPWVYSSSAHSVPLNMFATGGLLAGVPYLIVWWLVLRAGVRGLADPVNRTVLAGLLGVWTAYMADIAVSMDQPGVAVWGWLVAGCIIAVGAPIRLQAAGTRTSRASQAATGLAVLGIAVLAIAVPVRADAALGAATGMPTGTPAERTAAIASMLDSASMHPEPIRVLGVVGDLEALGDTRTAVVLATQAVGRFPRESLLWQALAEDLESVGDWQRAVWARERMLQLDPLNGQLTAALRRDRAHLA